MLPGDLGSEGVTPGLALKVSREWVCQAEGRACVKQGFQGCRGPRILRAFLGVLWEAESAQGSKASRTVFGGRPVMPWQCRVSPPGGDGGHSLFLWVCLVVYKSGGGLGCFLEAPSGVRSGPARLSGSSGKHRSNPQVSNGPAYILEKLTPQGWGP